MSNPVPPGDDKYNEHSVKYACEDLVRAQEHLADPKMAKLMAKHMKTKKLSLDMATKHVNKAASLDDIRNRRQHLRGLDSAEENMRTKEDFGDGPMNKKKMDEERYTKD